MRGGPPNSPASGVPPNSPQFQSAFRLWTEAVRGRVADDQVAIDGKALRGCPDADGGVEGMHWVMDVIFNEDRSRARERHAAENLATIRRIVNNILRMERDRGDPERPQRLKQLMRRAARFDDFRKRLLRVFCRTLDEEA